MPLAEISSASTRAEKLLSDGANWQEGIKVFLTLIVLVGRGGFLHQPTQNIEKNARVRFDRTNFPF